MDATVINLDLDFVPASQATWSYIGEGAQNIVLKYVGTQSALRGRALRVPKRLGGDKHFAAQHSGNAIREHWAEIGGRIGLDVLPRLDVVSGEQLDVEHWAALEWVVADAVRRGVRPVHRWEAVREQEQHDKTHVVGAGIDVDVDVNADTGVNDDVRSSVYIDAEVGGRKEASLAVEALETRQLSTVVFRRDSFLLLLDDLTSVPEDNDLADVCLNNKMTYTSDERTPFVRPITVEIKPKGGTLPHPSMVSPASMARGKCSICRFCLLQRSADGRAKRNEAYAAPEPSAYCPLDLFSKSQHRIRRALKALMCTPQNNLRIFDGGRVIFSGDAPRSEQGRFDNLRKLDDILCEAWFSHNPQRNTGTRDQHRGLELLTDSLSSILLDERVLERLRNLEEADVEEASYLYASLQSGRMIRRSSDDDDDDASEDSSWQLPHRTRASLDALTRPDAEARIHEFLLATVAKDCSLMITFANNPSRRSDSCRRQFKLLSSLDLPVSLEYRLKVIDFDLKDSSNIPRYLAQDRRILETAEGLLAPCGIENDSE